MSWNSFDRQARQVRAFLMAFAIALVGCGGGGPEKSDDVVSVEIYGDSILIGPTLQRNVAAQMRALRPGWSVVDVSASGSGLQLVLHGYNEPYPNAPHEAYPAGPQKALSRRQMVARYQVIAVGGNDALLGNDPAVFEAGLREAVQIIRSDGRVPIISGIVNAPAGDAFTPRVLLLRDELNAITLRVAMELGVVHAGWGEDYRGDADVIGDRIHRTQDASDRLAALLVAAVESAHKAEAHDESAQARAG